VVMRIRPPGEVMSITTGSRRSSTTRSRNDAAKNRQSDQAVARAGAHLSRFDRARNLITRCGGRAPLRSSITPISARDRMAGSVQTL